MATETPKNGSYVTWRELNLALAPIVTTVEDIQTTVNILHADFFEGLGATRERKQAQGNRHYWIGVLVSLLVAALTAAITILSTQ